MEGLNITELKKLARHYNLHAKIKNIQKLSKDDLISELKKHITFHDDHYTVKQDEYDLHDALKPKKRETKKRVKGAVHKKEEQKVERREKGIGEFDFEDIKKWVGAIEGMHSKYPYTERVLAVKSKLPQLINTVKEKSYTEEDKQKSMEYLKEFAKKYGIS